MVETSPYGAGKPAAGAADAAAAGGGPRWADVVDGQAWWAGARPAECGRITVVRGGNDGTAEEMLPAPWHARSRRHEYGGRAWVVREGSLFFTHWNGQRVCRREEDLGEITPGTPSTPEPPVRHGVRDAGPWPGREPRTLAAHHFLTAPQLSPDGRHAAWLGWEHPAMRR